MSTHSARQIASVIGNPRLAKAIDQAVSVALASPLVHLVPGRTSWDVFRHSLDAAIRNIEQDRRGRGQLFRRLIEHGPHYPGEPEPQPGASATTLSDAECAVCVEFIFSHMVNRFQGELAELLALEPCLALLQRLRAGDPQRAGIQLYWGEAVHERRQVRAGGAKAGVRWSSFAKGADGLLVEEVPGQGSAAQPRCKVHGVIEVKSMHLPSSKLLEQIDKHVGRLFGGVKLAGIEWPAERMDVSLLASPEDATPGLLRIMVGPSRWKLSRKWHYVREEDYRTMVYDEPAGPPPEPTETDAPEGNVWKITLAWSEEALSQAAYEMTFWYMSQVGARVYREQPLPKGWEGMAPNEAGYNAIKMMLYYMLLRVKGRDERLATRLYNVYGFGYPLGVDSARMLWPEDLPELGGAPGT